MLDIRVKTFLAVCRSLNYTHAAHELNLTQSAVSQHMAYLEKYYHVELVHKNGKTMELTDAGKELQRVYEVMMHDSMLLERKMLESGSSRLKKFNIGATMTAGEYIVAPSLARYLARHAEIQASIVSKSTSELLDMLHKGTIDCAFLEGFFDKTECQWDVLCSQKLVCICAPDNVLAHETHRVEDLLSSRLIVREQESGSRAVLVHALESLNYGLDSFSSLMEVNSINIIKTLVAENVGISFVYEAAVRQDIEEHKLACVQIEQLPLSHEITFVCAPRSVFEQEIFKFYEGVKEEFNVH